eukprot:4583625-Pleurochrysis_carterae.AAC.1
MEGGREEGKLRKSKRMRVACCEGQIERSTLSMAPRSGHAQIAIGERAGHEATARGALCIAFAQNRQSSNAPKRRLRQVCVETGRD